MRVGLRLLLIISLSWISSTVSSIQPPVAPRFPFEKRIQGDVEIDYYEWLRNKTNPAVYSYIQSENDYAFEVTSHTKDVQDNLYNDLFTLGSGVVPFNPIPSGNYEYYSKAVSGKDYPVWCRRSLTNRVESVILDENELAENSSYFLLGAMSVSPDENVLAYTIDYVGNEQFLMYFKRLNDNQVLPDVVRDVYYSIQWASDSKTVFYNKMDPVSQQAMSVYRHTLGAVSDVNVHNETDLTFCLTVSKTNSGKYILIYVQGMVTNEVMYLEASNPEGSFTVMYPRKENVQYFVQHRKDRFYIQTNEDDCYNYKIISVPENNINKDNWLILVPHSPNTMIMSIQAYSKFLAIWQLHETMQQIKVVKYENAIDQYLIPIPKSSWYALLRIDEIVEGNIFIFTNFETDDIRFIFNSFVEPVIYYSFSMSNFSLVKVSQETLDGYNRELYHDDRIFVPTRDGSNQTIPVTLVYKKEKRDTNKGNPMLLSAYAAYGDIKFPYWDPSLLALLDRGFVFAIAHVRGGAMRGTQWYLNGKLLHKKNSFYDFITVAEFFVERGWTSPSRLAAHGRSAGGLLMGAVLTMRPDLFKVVWMQVPFVDVINSMSDPTIPWSVWETYEWGNPSNNKEDYEYMKSYDPYLAVTARDYPNVLVESGWNDARVMYWEPTKLVAKLRFMKTDSNTIILRTSGSGHFSGSGDDYYQELAFEYSFLIDKLSEGNNNHHSPSSNRTWIWAVTITGTMLIIIAVVLVVLFRRYKRRLEYRPIKQAHRFDSFWKDEEGHNAL